MPAHSTTPLAPLFALGTLLAALCLVSGCARVSSPPDAGVVVDHRPRNDDAFWTKCEAMDSHASSGWVLIQDSAAVPVGTAAAWDLAFRPLKDRSFRSDMAGTTEREDFIQFGAYRGERRRNGVLTLRVLLGSAERTWSELREVVTARFDSSRRAVVLDRLPFALAGERCSAERCNPSTLTFTERGLLFDDDTGEPPTFEADRLARLEKPATFTVPSRAVLLILSESDELIACGRL